MDVFIRSSPVRINLLFTTTRASQIKHAEIPNPAQDLDKLATHRSPESSVVQIWQTLC